MEFSTPDSMSGHLLIAVPELGDGNFFRSVVLLFQHDEMGASGVILNRPSLVTISKVWDEVSEQESDCDQVINIGGPVEGPLIALHTSLVLAESQIVDGVFISMSRDHLNDLVDQGQHEFRIFSGYSGWGPGQLESEIDAGGWLTLPAQLDHVFDSPDQLWKKVCNTFGQQILEPQIGHATSVDPSLN